MRSISQIVQQFQQNWLAEIEPAAIEHACRMHGCRWRDRVLTPMVTVQVFLLQVLHGNTACTHLSKLSNLCFSAAAYCTARQRLKLDVLVTLLQRSVEQLQRDTFDTGRWRGHRVFLVDGSSFSMSDTRELQSHFGQPKKQQPGCGFPVAHWLALMHAGTGMLTAMLAAPLRTHSMSQVVELHPQLAADDVLLADRGFCSYAHVALLCQRGVHALLRIHACLIVDFTPERDHNHPRRPGSVLGRPKSRWLKQLGATDQLVDWLKPKSRPGWMTAAQFAALPDALTVRELRYEIQQPGFRSRQITLVTTLVDNARYPLEALADLYRQRWQIETNFAHLKTTLKMDVLKCQTVDGVLKELHMFALVYNLVRQVMLTAATRQGVAVGRISFLDALRWLQTATPDTPLSNLVVHPTRPHRHEPRVRKRRPKQYPLMHQPRRQQTKALARQ
jgi:IS4 transposase